MREQARRWRILATIERIWELPGCDDMRLGQMIVNAASSAFEDHPYNYEDSDLEKDLLALEAWIVAGVPGDYETFRLEATK